MRAAIELLKLSAVSGTKLCLSLTASWSQFGLRLLSNLGPSAAERDCDKLKGGEPATLQIADGLLAAAREAWAVLQRMVSLGARVAAAVLLACILYALPVWGSPLQVPLHVLPMRSGSEAAAQVEIAQWAASLSPGFVVVDAELDITVPNSPFNARSFERAGGTVRLDLELPGFETSHPLVLPQLSGAARLARELLWLVPMVLGFVYDEEALKLTLVKGARPQDILSAVNSAGAAAADAGEAAANVLLRIRPAIAVRSATLRFSLRPGGPLGRLLNSFFGFVPLCALLLYRSIFSESGFRWGSGDASTLTYVERQMLTKGLAGADGAISAHFAETLAAFEREDLRAHRGSLLGHVETDQLTKITNAARHEWKVGFDEKDMQRIISATLELPQTPGGLVTPDGKLKYKQWLAIATVAMLCGGRELAEYADWVACHGTKLA